MVPAPQDAHTLRTAPAPASTGARGLLLRVRVALALLVLVAALFTLPVHPPAAATGFLAEAPTGIADLDERDLASLRSRADPSPEQGARKARRLTVADQICSRPACFRPASRAPPGHA